MTGPRILAVIPARAGSKGLSGKNIRPLAGLPLIAHSIRAAALTDAVTRCVVSTDSEQIATVAREYGGETPFLRPAELAADDTPMAPVVRHALEWCEQEEGLPYAAVLLLDPDLLAGGADGLARAQPERHPGPAPGVDRERRPRRASRSAGAGSTPGLVGVGGQLRGRRSCRRCSGRGGSRRTGSPSQSRVARSTWALRVAQVARVDARRRLHRDQGEHLQQVALDHVDQRAGAVVVAGAALQRRASRRRRCRRVSTCSASSSGSKMRFANRRPSEVQDRGLAEEVVDPVDLVLGHERGRSRFRASALAASVPNGFSSTSAVPAGSAMPRQGLAGPRGDRRRQREVEGGRRRAQRR